MFGAPLNFLGNLHRISGVDLSKVRLILCYDYVGHVFVSIGYW